MVTNRAATLRELIAADDVLVTPGVYDGLTATLAARAGFESVYLGGYAAGASTAATEPMATATEMRDRAREVVHNVSLPLLVDGGAGFGDPAHTYRSVREFAKTGVAAVHIEDQVYPKRLHYHAGAVHLVPEAEMATKVEAAARAIDEMDEDLVLVARSDAGRRQRRVESGETVEDAVARVNAYLDAGAEAAMLFPGSIDELEYAADHVDGPLVFVLVESYVGDWDRPPTVEALSDLGVEWCVFAISASVATARAVSEVFESIREDGRSGLDPGGFAATRELIEDAIDLPRYYDIEARSGKRGTDDLHHEGRNG